MTTMYFQNTKTGKKYRVVSVDRDAGKITLQGSHAQFTEDYDKERFQRLGYKLIKEEPADA